MPPIDRAAPAPLRLDALPADLLRRLPLGPQSFVRLLGSSRASAAKLLDGGLQVPQPRRQQLIDRALRAAEVDEFSTAFLAQVAAAPQPQYAGVLAVAAGDSSAPERALLGARGLIGLRQRVLELGPPQSAHLDHVVTAPLLALLRRPLLPAVEASLWQALTALPSPAGALGLLPLCHAGTSLPLRRQQQLGAAWCSAFAGVVDSQQLLRRAACSRLGAATFFRPPPIPPGAVAAEPALPRCLLRLCCHQPLEEVDWDYLDRFWQNAERLALPFATTCGELGVALQDLVLRFDNLRPRLRQRLDATLGGSQHPDFIELAVSLQCHSPVPLAPFALLARAEGLVAGEAGLSPAAQRPLAQGLCVALLAACIDPRRPASARLRLRQGLLGLASQTQNARLQHAAIQILPEMAEAPAYALLVRLATGAVPLQVADAAVGALVAALARQPPGDVRQRMLQCLAAMQRQAPLSSVRAAAARMLHQPALRPCASSPL